MKKLIYLVEGYSPFSKASQVLDTYVEAKDTSEQFVEMGYISSITPMELSREEFSQALEIAMKDYFTENSLGEINV